MSMGVQVIAWRGAEVAGRLADASMDALEAAGEDILTEALQEVPWDTGDLGRSGTVEREGDKVLIRFIKEYAAKQHEEPSYSHGHGRKWKYLEDPLRRRGGEVIKTVGKAVQLLLRG